MCMIRVFLVILVGLQGASVVVGQILQWRVVGAMQEDRHWHSSVVLRDGRLLISGGVTGASTYVDGAGTDGMPTRSCDLYDPVLNTVVPAAFMNVPRSQFPSVVLDDGRVLVFGGLSTSAPAGACTDLIEAFDPVANSWTVVGRMTSPRRLHGAVKLSNQHVLVVGGALSSQVSVSTAEIFDIVTGISSQVSSLPETLKEGVLLDWPGVGPAYVGGRTGGPNSPRQKYVYVFRDGDSTWKPLFGSNDLPLLTSIVPVDEERFMACGGNVSENPPVWSRGVFSFKSGEVERILDLPVGIALHSLESIGDQTALLSGGLDEELEPQAATYLVDVDNKVILFQPNHQVPRALHSLVKLFDPVQGLTYFAVGGLNEKGRATATIEKLVVGSQDALRQRYVSSIVTESGPDHLSVMPNPASDFLTVHGAEGCSFVIYSNLGEVVMSQKIPSESHRVDVSACVPGMYYVHARSATGQTRITPLVVSR